MVKVELTKAEWKLIKKALVVYDEIISHCETSEKIEELLMKVEANL